MDALSYEMVIRRAYQCGRYGSTGANADIYRAFEMAYREFDDKVNGRFVNSTETLQQLAYKAGHEAGRVAAFIDDAIDKALNTFGSKMSDEQKTVLTDVKVTLFYPDKTKIESAVDRVSQVFSDIGLNS